MRTDPEAEEPSVTAAETTTPELTDEQLADFDSTETDPVTPPNSEPGGDAIRQEGGDSDAAGETGAEGEDGEGDAAGDKETFDPELLKAVASDGPVIPKPRFDEATARLKDELRASREEADALRAKLPTTPPRDFAAESTALEERYEAGEIDDEQYRKDLRALERDIGREEGRAQREREIIEQQQTAAAASWAKTIHAWETENADFLANGYRRRIVKDLLEEYGKDPNLSDDELIAKMQAEAFEAANWNPAGGASATEDESTAPPAKPGNPHAARDARDAKAQASASAAPLAASAGAGNRGTRPGLPANLVGVKGKDYDSLPKDLREAKELADF